MDVVPNIAFWLALGTGFVVQGFKGFAGGSADKGVAATKTAAQVALRADRLQSTSALFAQVGAGFVGGGNGDEGAGRRGGDKITGLFDSRRTDTDT